MRRPPPCRLAKGTNMLGWRCLPAPRRFGPVGIEANSVPSRGRKSDLGQHGGLPMGDLIEVKSDTVDKLPADLPRMVRLALGYGSKLQRGTLDVTLPDGRTVRLRGDGP